MIVIDPDKTRFSEYIARLLATKRECTSGSERLTLFVLTPALKHKLFFSGYPVINSIEITLA